MKWILLAIIALLVVAGCAVSNTNPDETVSTDNGRIYTSDDQDKCALIRFMCVEGMRPFFDDTGCGCEPGLLEPPQDEGPTDCYLEQRDVDECIEIYAPVCGWFDESIQCLTYPCASTYSNSCFACQNEDVSYWTNGECPALGSSPQ